MSFTNFQSPAALAVAGLDYNGNPLLGAVTSVQIGTSGTTVPSTPSTYAFSPQVACGRPCVVSVSVSASSLTGATVLDQGCGFANGQLLTIANGVIVVGSNWVPQSAE